MLKSVRVAPKTESDNVQIITFVLAIGSVRQVCQLETTFRTENRAFNYLHKHRTAFERVARAKLEHAEIENGVIQFTML